MDIERVERSHGSSEACFRGKSFAHIDALLTLKEVADYNASYLQDVAIATFLICLWKLMYTENGGHPLGGFVDIGCGNGLL